MSDEVFVNIDWNPKYEISNHGRVRTLDTNTIKVWGKAQNGYPAVVLWNGFHPNGKRNAKQFLISRLVASHFIPNPSNKKYVDHIDRNPQNNHVSNLRWVTRSENNMNAIKRSNCSSVYKGVSYENRRNCWRAYIAKDSKKYINLGYFQTEWEAAQAYNNKAKEIFGEYCYLNVNIDASI